MTVIMEVAMGLILQFPFFLSPVWHNHESLRWCRLSVLVFRTCDRKLKQTNGQDGREEK